MSLPYPYLVLVRVGRGQRRVDLHGVWHERGPRFLSRGAADTRGTEGAAYGAVSLHPGGMNTTFADGSVHFLADTMDVKVYQHIGHHRDGLPIGGAPH